MTVNSLFGPNRPSTQLMTTKKLFLRHSLLTSRFIKYIMGTIMKMRMPLIKRLKIATSITMIRKKRRKTAVSIMFTLKDGTLTETANKEKMRKWMLRTGIYWQQFNYLSKNRKNKLIKRKMRRKNCKLNSRTMEIKFRTRMQLASSSKRALALTEIWLRQ